MPEEKLTLEMMKNMKRQQRIIPALFGAVFAARVCDVQYTKAQLFDAVYEEIPDLTPMQFEDACTELQEFNWEVQAIVDPDGDKLQRLIQEKTR